MRKAANTYSDNAKRRNAQNARPQVARRRRRAAAQHKRRSSWWLSFCIVVSIFAMLVVSINLRAFTEAREEVDKHARLSEQLQNLMDENLALQEEIHSIRTDPRVIEREAKRIGIDLRQEKVPMPVN